MSLGYAEKLSYIEDVGKVGMSEIFDPLRVLQEKIERLGIMFEKSKHLVVFTGAGISTSCGIPDFRGPKGIWTLQVSADCLKHDKDVIFQKLRDRAIRNPCCGQKAVIERKVIIAPRSEVTAYAAVTDFIGYN